MWPVLRISVKSAPGHVWVIVRREILLKKKLFFSSLQILFQKKVSRLLFPDYKTTTWSCVADFLIVTNGFWWQRVSWKWVWGIWFPDCKIATWLEPGIKWRILKIRFPGCYKELLVTEMADSWECDFLMENENLFLKKINQHLICCRFPGRNKEHLMTRIILGCCRYFRWELLQKICFVISISFISFLINMNR